MSLLLFPSRRKRFFRELEAGTGLSTPELIFLRGTQRPVRSFFLVFFASIIFVGIGMALIETYIINEEHKTYLYGILIGGGSLGILLGTPFLLGIAQNFHTKRIKKAAEAVRK